nr:hypothetical protein [Rhizobium phaseoli]
MTCTKPRSILALHHPRECAGEGIALKTGEHGEQRHRHVLHVTLLSGVNSHLGQKFRLDLKGERLYRIELLSSFSIEGAVEGSGKGILRQRLTRRQPVGRGRFMIFCIRSRKQLPEVGFEDCLVDHDRTCCLVRARYISRRVPV